MLFCRLSWLVYTVFCKLFVQALAGLQVNVILAIELLWRLIWRLQSRVGDRPTATILQVQFHFFLIFAWVFKTKYSTKICPSQEDQLYFKMEGRRSRPSNLLYIYPFQEGHIFVEQFALKNQAKIKKMKLHLQNCSSWSISHS